MKSDADQIKHLLAFMLVGAFISCIPLLIFKTIPRQNEQIITYMVGQLSGMALTALGFYFVNKAGQDAAEAKRAELDTKRAETTGKLADVASAALATAGQTDPAAIKEGDAVTITKET